MQFMIQEVWVDPEILQLDQFPGDACASGLGTTLQVAGVSSLDCAVQCGSH